MAKPGIKEAERQSTTKVNTMQRGRRNVHMKVLKSQTSPDDEDDVR